MPPVLRSPHHAVVGATDLGSAHAFLAAFGFESTAAAELPSTAARALYGLESPTRELSLVMPGAPTGGIRLVETPHPPTIGGPYDPRPIAIDLYTRDLDRSIARARKAGAHIGTPVDYALGPLTIKEVEVTGPDDLVVVFLDVSARRPSVLDRDPDAACLHSEVHSIVFAVPSAARALETWRDVAGLDVLIDAPIEGPVLSQLMDLPRPNVPVRFVLLCDDEHAPARFEIIEFVEDPGEAHPTWPLAGGLHAVAFQVEDLETACETLSGCSFGPTVELATAVHPGARAVAGHDPDGLRFEIWQGAT